MYFCVKKSSFAQFFRSKTPIFGHFFGQNISKIIASVPVVGWTRMEVVALAGAEVAEQ
jgi:hypothetical protein